MTLCRGILMLGQVDGTFLSLDHLLYLWGMQCAGSFSAPVFVCMGKDYMQFLTKG